MSNQKSTISADLSNKWWRVKSTISIALAMILALTLLIPLGATSKSAFAGESQSESGISSSALPTEVDYLGDVYNLPSDHVFENVTYERLKYILGYNASNQSLSTDDHVYDYGYNVENYAIVFGGPETASSQATIGYINEVAKEYGVTKIYHFDPRLAGADGLDITDTSLVAAYSNLWSHATNGLKARLKNSDPSYTSTDTYLFVYNKDHKNAENASEPIVAGVVSKAASLGSTQANLYKQKVAEVFEAAGVDAVTNKADIAEYPFFDYFRTRINNTVGVGQSPANSGNYTYQNVWIQDSERDNFAIQTVTFPQLLHILDSTGDFAIFLGGTWCPYTSPTDAIANAAAVNSGVNKVYQFDLRLDGASSTTSLKTALSTGDNGSYPYIALDTDGDNSEGSHLYAKLINKLSGLQLEPDVAKYWYHPDGDITKDKVAAKSIGVPFLFEYNKDNKAADGSDSAVTTEWIGYKPVADELYAYAWYTKNDVRDYWNDPAYREKQLGRPVDPDVDDVIGNGANSGTIALPALTGFFGGIAAHRVSEDPWSYNPTNKPKDNSLPTPDGGCGADAKDVELTIEEPILGQNGNAGYDVQNYDINVLYREPLSSTTKGNIKGDTVITAKALTNLSEIKFDFRASDVQSVTVNGQVAAFTGIDDVATDTHKIVVTPAIGISNGSIFKVEVIYRAVAGTYKFNGKSTQGLVPSVNSSGVTGLGEPNGATFWFPSNNNTTDRATFDVTLTAPANLVGVSGGKLINKTVIGTLVSRQWEQEQTTIPYLVTASFGDYVEFAQDITLTDGSVIPSWSYVDKTLYNKTITNKNKTYYYAKELQDYIQWAEGHFGKYPGETAGFIFENLKDGENTVGYSLEINGRPFYSGIPDTSTFVHELLHQWFGDSLTIAKWEDLWLNEGFASFLSNIYFEDTDNKTETTNDWYRQWFAEATDSDFWYIAPADPWNTANLFTDITYGRGSYALAALRAAVGDEDFFNIVTQWGQRNAGKSVSTQEFIALAKELAGVDSNQLGTLLNTWIYEQYKPASFPTALARIDDGGNNDNGEDNNNNDNGEDNNNNGNNNNGNNNNGNNNNGNGTNNGTNNNTDDKFDLSAAGKNLESAVIKTISKSTALIGTSSKPKLSVQIAGVTLVEGKDYTVTYKNNKTVGKATATIKGLGEYAGTEQVITYTINPNKTKIVSAKASKKALTVSWTKAAKAAKVTNYKVQYKAKGASNWLTKNVKSTKNKVKLTNLKSGKKYQVRVQVQKRVGKATYSSVRSSVKTSSKIK